jgi:hypothetical protein
MPIPVDFAAEYIGVPDSGRVMVFTGARTVMSLKNPKVIELDGRRYSLDGKVHFKNGVALSAKFDVDTTGFDLLVLNSLKVYCDGLWYHWWEQELVAVVGAKDSDEILPFTWSPSAPLKYNQSSPYPMRFHEKHTQEIVASIRRLHRREELPLSDNNSSLFFNPIHWH